jgi:hypothetical protein
MTALNVPLGRIAKVPSVLSGLLPSASTAILFRGFGGPRFRRPERSVAAPI